MKSILILLLTFFSAFPAAAQNPDKNIEQQYKDALSLIHISEPTRRV